MKLCKVTLAVALVAAACLPAVAQSQMGLNIPFDFTVNGKTLPAGYYHVWETLQSDSDGWAIQGEHVVAMIITHRVQSSEREHTLSLVFLRVGNRHFLTQIWNNAHSGHELQLPNMKSLIVAEANTKQYIEIAAK